MLFSSAVCSSAKARLEGTSPSGTKQEVKPSTQSSVGEDKKPPPRAHTTEEKEEQLQEEDKKTEEETETKMEVVSSSGPKGWQLKLFSCYSLS